MTWLVFFSSSRAMLLWGSILLLFSGVMQLFTVWSILRLQGPAVPALSGAGLKGPELSQTLHEYSWLGDDYPLTLPLDLPTAALPLENSRHYSLDGPDADAEFQSIYPGRSRGFVRLGPNKRFFGLSVYHQIHCLDSLRLAILGIRPHDEHRLGESGTAHWEMDHVHHCLNYLRQTILCASDLTLEPEVVEGSNDAEEGLGVTHVCRDWSTVHRYVEKNFEDWEIWRSNITSTSSTL
ncbi:hypothetical protein BV25DRAFT_643907 [Artomyces pyxidatus]|uniref:Uncharacterized protein n=1 Tax=Artomyces pyxidatus TaxID=48021 RepID=A0ACB8T211_9AGAM|nr:hypothetical protein BV25DRAFT_643907 [Artomyces pyxidatus]